MKKKVRYSIYNHLLTIAIIAAIGGISCIAFIKGEWAGAALTLLILLPLIGSALFFTPLSVAVDAEHIVLRMALRKRRFALSDVADARLCPPTMGALRLFGSGGFMGYWGWFRERDIGKYFAYHGKASDCFLITLRDGHKYLLGCADAPTVVGYIRTLSRLGKTSAGA